jgi:chemosensory pili system protein ChpA (sensor histidine kinase/response regulator)
MMLEGTNASSAIAWVRQDLDDCLQTVRENLEVFAEDSSQREPLRKVQDELERLNLTFSTMQQHGAGILTDEMIAVGGHMLSNGAAGSADSLAALTDAVIVLPSYLDRLQAGHEDLPILLLPTLNELRATYDESLLSEGTLFAPELDMMIPEMSGSEADAVAQNEFGSFSRRVRSQYQQALLGWLKEQSKDELLRPLQDVCNTLVIRLGRHDLRRLWWIANNTISGLRDGAIDNDLPLRRLFARLDLMLKAMVEGGPQGPLTDAVTALSRALLFYAAQARPGSKGTDLLRERFRLEELIPDRAALLRARGAVTGRDAELFRSIGDAVREELGLVKDALDMELRTGRVEPDQRESSKASLRQLADTLEMLNLPVPAKAVEDLLPELEEMGDEANTDLDSPLLVLAQRLLEVESILDTHIELLGEPMEEQAGDGFISLPLHEQRQILSRMLDECVISLHQVQDVVRKHLDGDREPDYHYLLDQIAGALLIAGQNEVAALTQKLERSLNAALAMLADSDKGEEVRLDDLTDAVAALELYLAGLRDGQANSLAYLEVMHGRLEGLPEADAGGEQLAATQIQLPSRKQPPTDERTEAEESQATTAAIDPAILEVFLEEFDAVADQIRQHLAAWLDNPVNTNILEDIKRGFHTLKGSGRMVGAVELGEFAWKMENLLNGVVEKKIPFTEAIGDTTTLAVGALDDLKARMLGEPAQLNARGLGILSQLAHKLSKGEDASIHELQSELPAELLSLVMEVQPEPTDTEVEETAGAAADAEEAPLDLPGSGELDPTLVQLMSGEINQYISQLAPLIEPAADDEPKPVTRNVVRAAHSLAGALAMAPVGEEAQLARALEALLQAQQNTGRPPSPDAALAMQHCLHRFRQRLSILEGASDVSYPREDSQLLADLAQLTELAPSAVSAAQPPPGRAVETLPASGDRAGDAPAEGLPSQVPETRDLRDIQIENGDIIAIFLEEAGEVLERCDTLLNTWRDKLTDQKLVQNLQREIHTFKGGARMAGLEHLGDLSHAMESLLEQIAERRLQATVAAVQALEEGCDWLTVWVEQLESGVMPQAGDALQRFRNKALVLTGREPEPVAVPDEPLPVAEAEQPAPEEAGLAAESEILIQREPSEADALSGDTAEPQVDTGAEQDRQFHDIPDRPAAAPDGADGTGVQAQIRVAADLMDSLVNHAGEISIYRSRVEQQLGAARYNLKEVGQTVARLKEQLRKMDMESEAQMASRYQRASKPGSGSSEFDPLELDRFSNMQQLSRSLTESVSDLVSLQEMIEESVSQAESLLVQQSRVSTDLQEGLMQTRMTPFGSAAPRLRRVVRAAANETGKRARLQLRMAGSTDQLDRNVLERITAPLEHMLRNSVVHGIEMPKVRRKLKKPEEGQITVSVTAEATEFVVRVEDDGSGVDLQAVRERAIERRMIAEDEQLEDQRLIQFILDSGFTTSKTVTGLAGRGVGMDVVNSEIRQIGGSMEIASEAGRGTRFTIRIPFSLAVMQAIGVTIGDRSYMIPLNSVAGVTRMTPAEYSNLVSAESPSYEFAGEAYSIIGLEPVLGLPPQALDSENVSLLMIRAGEHKAAFRVAELQGHQEVVIKPVGPQISSVPGILGGTISADGQVVIILDMGPMIRRGLALAKTVSAEIEAEVEETRPPLVMVVDDSITMRKVTSRVLENHQLEVMTAQDGVDAIENLHERVPDLMLLDIEMPRMDGYELLQHVRSDSRLRHVPIVMITSRSGQKHRKKARKAGANDYLTKPYQEAELVAKVGEILELDLKQRRAD